ncbi:MAG: S46 family peptidase [Sphingobacteriales bacterium JAD_PAG50586_3]|nr:MAG: S46 family peptidase [Sphingobacteriales bacterium JAD_PAG50586_3]
MHCRGYIRPGLATYQPPLWLRGYSKNSTVDHDYLANGFWAKDVKSDLAAPGYTASFLVRIDDVTAKVSAELTSDMDEAARNKKIAEVMKKLEDEATAGTTYNAKVKGFFENAEFYLFVYETFTDVRLVGAPPSSVGKFGGDTDNWMWPRHTGDFSLLRVYMGKDGKPAPYNVDNVPYKPKKALSISIDGVKDGDFTMVMGNPGRTDRYLTSEGVKLLLDQTAPAIVKIRDLKLSIYKKDMDASPKVKIQYASKYARTANYWKYYIGQSAQLKKNRVYEKKLKVEADFDKWANSDKDLTAKYGSAINKINAGFSQIRDYNIHRTYLNESILRTCEAVALSLNYGELEKLLDDQGKATDAKTKAEEMKKDIGTFFADYNAPTDKKLLAAMLQLFRADVPADQIPDIYKTIDSEFGGDYVKFADKVFETSIFVDQARLEKFLDAPDAATLKNDWSYKIANSFVSNWRGGYAMKLKAIEDAQDKDQRLFIQGLREMNPSKAYAPDANSTMRLTYGNVKSYIPQDAVFYDYYTTLDGIIAKEDTTNEEFIVPAKLKDLYNKKDYGRFADSDGKMHVNFISNNDITGGNSGSPVLNGYGELIGCAFDGNWEAMSGDIYFDPLLKRTISVDIRYVLFIIEKYAGADNLIKEMNLSIAHRQAYKQQSP